MPNELFRPFETIECALEFMTLLEAMVVEVSADLQARLAAPVTERHKNGLNLASYKVNQLSSHVQKSRRILNDLAMIRKVLVAGGTPPPDPQNARHLTDLVHLEEALLNEARTASPAQARPVTTGNR